MQVVTLLNEKGGVGKTTLAVHLAAGLAARGKRVLLIDGDAQGHSTIRTGLNKSPGFYDLLVRSADWGRTVFEIPAEKYGVPGERLPGGRLLVVPSNIETRSITSSMGSNVKELRNRLDELDGRVDVVIIDTSPTPSLLHGVIYSATDLIILPTTLSYTSFDGLVESLTHKEAADNFRINELKIEGIRVGGIVPVMYRKNTIEQDENLRSLNEQFGDLVWEPIPLRTLWTETESRRLPVWAIDPNSEAAFDAWNAVDRVEEVLSVRA